LKQKDFENNKDFRIILSSLTYLGGLVLEHKSMMKFVHRKHDLLVLLDHDNIINSDSLDFSKVEYEEIQDVINNFLDPFLLEDFASVVQALQWLLNNNYPIFTKVQLKIFRMSFYYFIKLMWKMSKGDIYDKKWILNPMLRNVAFYGLRQYRHFLLKKITVFDIMDTAAKLGIEIKLERYDQTTKIGNPNSGA
jgi:hypothetical protein